MPIPREHVTEPTPFAVHSIPTPVLARNLQPVPVEAKVGESWKSDEAPTVRFTVVPITTGLATFVDAPAEPPQGRVIFRKPNVSAAFGE